LTNCKIFFGGGLHFREGGGRVGDQKQARSKLEETSGRNSTKILGNLLTSLIKVSPFRVQVSKGECRGAVLEIGVFEILVIVGYAGINWVNFFQMCQMFKKIKHEISEHELKE
jgi:hypothetical protein